MSSKKKQKQVKLVENNSKTDMFSNQKIKDKIEKLSGEDIEVIVNPEDDLFESGRQVHQNINVASDLDLPVQTKGPFSPIDRSRWIVAVENLLIKGVPSAQKIAKLTGLSVPTTSSFIKEIKAKWAEDLTIPEVNVRREKLYNENEKISQFCWAKIQADPDDKNIINYLKLIGESSTRRARLVGAEVVSLNVEKANTMRLSQDEMQQHAAKLLEVKPEDLKQLGDALALELSGQKDNEDE
jgi:hypothetical protein